MLVSNTSATKATLQRVEVLDAGKEGEAVQVFEGAGLLARMRRLSNSAADNPEIEFSGTRLLVMDLAFSSRAAVPLKIEHRFQLLGAETPARTPGTAVSRTYVIAPAVSLQVRTIGPPLAGKHWVALNGCCGATEIVHRTSSLGCNGSIYYAQRFAIDWMRLNDAGFIVAGDAAKVGNYIDYGADILAVADGTVSEVLDTQTDQPPGELPDPKTINLQNVDGNHVVLDLGGGTFAFYAHLQKNSVRVQAG